MTYRDAFESGLEDSRGFRLRLFRLPGSRGVFLAAFRPDDLLETFFFDADTLPLWNGDGLRTLTLRPLRPYCVLQS